MDPATNQTALSMDLVTSERTVSAANALRHIHDEQVNAIDDTCLDLATCGK
jgi:hypothetical protein